MRVPVFALIITILMLILVGVTANVALAQMAPFHPGDALYFAQDFAEQNLMSVTLDSTARAHYSIDLLQRRLADLTNSGNKSPNQQQAAVQEFNRALDRAVSLVSISPEAAWPGLRSRLAGILDSANAFLMSQPNAALSNRIAGLRTIVVDLSIPLSNIALPAPFQPVAQDAAAVQSLPTATAQPQGETTVDPHMVFFQPDSPGGMHMFFPLSGKHTAIACEECHVSGFFAGTAKECLTCHKKDAPAGHWMLSCDTCHSTEAWKPATFSHSAVNTTDCISCHADKKPANHFDGQCSLCHNTVDWKQATFNHQAVNATNCISCHSDKKPANHFDGQCSGCHNTTDWKQATFNHAFANATNCISCHSDKKPANHFDGQCSGCHNTKSWAGATFNHAFANATNCQSCHNKDKPANHFNGQCSACHNTNAWKPANFNHAAAGATDCQSCHNRPANHFAGQCSSCHNTNAWLPANFNHAAAGATDCQSCHNKDKPANHFAGQCSQCHNTNSWAGATFNHSFPLNHGGANSNCASCHPGGGTAWTCWGCHNQSETVNHHTQQNILNIDGQCMKCHANGGGG